MMQVRSATRERELSIRQAIGASRLRLARLLLTESVLLAAVGGTLASLVLFNAPTVVSRLSGQPIPVPLQDALKLDLSMVATCIGLCLLTSLVFGFLPAIRFSRPVIISALKDDADRRVAGRPHHRVTAAAGRDSGALLVMGGISPIESAQRQHRSRIRIHLFTQRRGSRRRPGSGLPRRRFESDASGQSCQGEVLHR
jgi:hypothetical protein